MHKEDAYSSHADVSKKMHTEDALQYKEKGQLWYEFWQELSYGISYGRTSNESIICFTDEQEAETLIVETNKYRGWTAQLYQSQFQRQLHDLQNNTKQQCNRE